MTLQGSYDLTRVGIETEVTYNVDPASGLIRWPGLVMNIPSFTEDFGTSQLRGLGAGRDPGAFYRTKQEIALTLESLLSDDDAGNESVFGLLLGSVPSVSTGIITNQNLLRSFTLETGYDDGTTEWYELFTGCMINMLSLEIVPQEFLKMTADIFAADLTRSSSEVSRTADNVSDLVDHTTGSFDHGDVTITIAGLTAPLITTFTVEFNNNLTRIYGIDGSLAASQIFPTKRDVTGAFTLARENDILLDIYTADPGNSHVDITLEFSKNSKNEYLKIELIDCRLLTRNFDRAGDEVAPLYESYDYQANSVRVTVGDTIAPVITLTGANPLTVERFGTYSDPGATSDDGSSVVVDSSAVDMTATGTYTVTYTSTDAEGNVGTATRSVVVADTVGPVITLTGANPYLVELGSTYTDPGATADGGETVTDDSSTVVDMAVLGDYTVTYTATDDEGNVSTVTRTVTVQDTTAPVITLTGANPLAHTLGDAYVDPGATADGGETVTNDSATVVDVDTAGTYTVTYTATDSEGNVGTATRDVVVS